MLDIPITMPAYFGAMSMWLTLNLHGSSNKRQCGDNKAIYQRGSLNGQHSARKLQRLSCFKPDVTSRSNPGPTRHVRSLACLMSMWWLPHPTTRLKQLA